MDAHPRLGRTTLAATVFAALLLVLPAFVVPHAKAANVTIHLFGSFSPRTGWSLTSGTEADPGPPVSVNEGDHVTLQLTSDDGAPHIFWIDYNADGQPQVGEPQSAQFTASTTYTFDALQAGTFTYWCLIHKPSMHGTWTTNAPAGAIAPTVTAVAATPASQVPGGAVNLTARATDDVAVTAVSAHIVGPSFDENLTMTRLGASTFYLNRTYEGVGTYTVTVWARDDAGNFGRGETTFTIRSGGLPLGLLEWIVAIAVVAIVLLAVGLLVRRRQRTRNP